jgi:hypothetical protein
MVINKQPTHKFNQRVILDDLLALGYGLGQEIKAGQGVATVKN